MREERKRPAATLRRPYAEEEAAEPRPRRRRMPAGAGFEATGEDAVALAEPEPAERTRRRRPGARRRRQAEPGGEPEAAAAPAFEADIVPPQSVAGRALVTVVAIMAFLSCVMVGIMTVVQGAARDWQGEVVRELTVEVRPVDGVSMAGQLADVRRLVEAAPGIARARALSGEEIEALLAPWLGVDGPLDALPVPRLVAVTVADPAAVDLPDLRQRVARVPGASLDDHRLWAERLSAMANAVTAAVLVLTVLILFALSLSVVFATRAAMSRNEETIAVLHLVGAEPGFIARQFQRHFLMLGLKGGAVGGGLATLAFLSAGLLTGTESLSGTAAATQARALAGDVSVGIAGYASILVIVALVTVLTGLTTRLAVHGHLARLA